jgi:hypothetical protein
MGEAASNINGSTLYVVVCLYNIQDKITLTGYSKSGSFFRQGANLDVEFKDCGTMISHSKTNQWNGGNFFFKVTTTYYICIIYYI